MNPSVYIIAGPNGAGKTTFAREFLPKYADCRVFVNADLIAQQMSPNSPESAAIGAGRLMLEEIEALAGKGVGFGFETTLAGKGHVNVVRGLKGRGYDIHLFYLWVPSADFSLRRVSERVSQGGHDIPEVVVRRRYERSIKNFFTHYSHLADRWILYDNSGPTPVIIAYRERGQFLIADSKRYNGLVASYGIK